jgi:hypothetical protein
MFFVEVAQSHGVDQNLVEMVYAFLARFFVQTDGDMLAHLPEFLNGFRALMKQQFGAVSVFRFYAHTEYWNVFGHPGIRESVRKDPCHGFAL